MQNELCVSERFLRHGQSLYQRLVGRSLPPNEETVRHSRWSSTVRMVRAVGESRAIQAGVEKELRDQGASQARWAFRLAQDGELVDDGG